MRTISVLVTAGMVLAFAGSLMGAETAGEKGPESVSVTNDSAKVLAAVERILKGERVTDADLKNLDKAVIRLETAAPGAGLDTGKGVEGDRGEAAARQRNLYILRFDSGGSDERQLHLLRIQREILKNQLILLKSLNAIANHQVMLASRSARVENTMRDITLGMKASSREMARVLGETSSANAKMTDVVTTTVDMAKTVEEIAKGIDDIESSMKSMDIEMSKMADNSAGSLSDFSRDMRRMARDINLQSSED